MIADECPKCHRLVFKQPHSCDGKYPVEPKPKTYKPKTFERYAARLNLSPLQAGYLMAILSEEGGPIAEGILERLLDQVNRHVYNKGG